MTARLLAGAVLMVAALCGCYRIASPPALGETLAVRIVPGEARLVRAQGQLQAEVASQLNRQLGWRIAPDGSARLDLRVDEELIHPAGLDARGLTQQWRVVILCQALLASRRGTILKNFSGTGYYTSLANEPEALKAAAADASRLIAAWLEAEVLRFK